MRSRHTGTLIDSAETDDSVQVKELPGSDGEIARVNAWRASALQQTRSAHCMDAGASNAEFYVVGGHTGEVVSIHAGPKPKR